MEYTAKQVKALHHNQCTFVLKSLNAAGTFKGYASVFGVIDGHRDMMMPGAFRQSLSKKHDIKLLWQHKPEEPIGIFTHISEDARGLYVEGKILMDVARGKEAYSLLKSGAIRGLSIGYTATEYDYDDDTGVRFLHAVDVWEISLVTFPANEQALVTDIKHKAHEHEDAALSQSLEQAIGVLSNA